MRKQSLTQNMLSAGKNAMQDAYELVMKKSQDSALKQKKQYDKHVRAALLLPGDCVLIKNMTSPVVAQVSLNHTGKRKFILSNPILETILQCTKFIQKVDMVDHEYYRNMFLPYPELSVDFAPCQPKIKNKSQKSISVPNVYA